MYTWNILFYSFRCCYFLLLISPAGRRCLQFSCGMACSHDIISGFCTCEWMGWKNPEAFSYTAFIKHQQKWQASAFHSCCQCLCLTAAPPITMLSNFWCLQTTWPLLGPSQVGMSLLQGGTDSLTAWCRDNNLELNGVKAVETTAGFRRGSAPILCHVFVMTLAH